MHSISVIYISIWQRPLKHEVYKDYVSQMNLMSSGGPFRNLKECGKCVTYENTDRRKCVNIYRLQGFLQWSHAKLRLNRGSNLHAHSQGNTSELHRRDWLQKQRIKIMGPLSEPVEQTWIHILDFWNMGIWH